MRTAKLMVTVLTIAVSIAILGACGASEATPTATTTGAAAGQPATSTPATGTTTRPAGTAAPTVTRPSGTAQPTDDSAAVSAAVDEVLVAIQERDRDRLHDLSGDQLRDRTRDADRDHVVNCLPEGASVQIVSRDVTITGDTATVTVTFEVTTADGATQTVERVWTFARQPDGTWRLAEMPECPFQP